MPLPFPDQAWIEPDRRVVEERVAVHRGRIDVAVLAGRDDGDRFFRIHRYSEVLGKVVQGPERQDPEWNSVPTRAEATVRIRAVSASCHHGVELARRDLPHGLYGRGRQVGPRQELKRGLDPVAREGKHEPSVQRGIAEALGAAGGLIDQHGSAHGRW